MPNGLRALSLWALLILLLPVPLHGQDPHLRIVVLTMGQADSTLVIGNGKTLLIDCGEKVNTNSTHYLHVADAIQRYTGRKHVDYFVLSHYHFDHMGKFHKYTDGRQFASGIFGLVESEGITIGTVIDRGDALRSPTSKIFKDYTSKIEEWKNAGKVGQRLTAVKGIGQIDLGSGIKVDIVAVNGEGIHEELEQDNPTIFDDCPPSENDFSVALKISLNDFEFFTGGDLTGNFHDEDYEVRSFGGDSCSVYTNVEKRIAANVGDIEIYRANHHGSGHSSSPAFLTALDPEFILISCGGGYDHPQEDLAYRMARTGHLLITTAVSEKEWPDGFKIIKSDIVGDIDVKVFSGGSTYTIQGSQHRSYSDTEEAQEKDFREERKFSPQNP